MKTKKTNKKNRWGGKAESDLEEIQIQQETISSRDKFTIEVKKLKNFQKDNIQRITNRIKWSGGRKRNHYGKIKENWRKMKGTSKKKLS